MKLLIAVSAALGAAGLVAAGGPGEKPMPDRTLIQGTWEVVSVKEAGRSPRVPDGLRFVVTGDTLSIRPGKGDPIPLRYTLDPAARPKALDTAHEVEPGKPVRQLGIYARDGDELKVCLGAAGQPRPAKFESNAGDSSVVWVLKRAK